MFHVRNVCVWILVVASFLSGRVAVASAVEPRTISLEVRLTTPAGSPPEAGVPVTVNPCRGGTTTVPTNASGVAEFSMEIPTGCEWIAIRIDQLSFRLDSSAANASHQERVQTLENNWSVPPTVELRLDAAESAYAVDLPLVPAVKVMGKVVGSNGERRGVRVDRDGRFNMGMVLGRVSGRFEVSGVPKGRSSLLYLCVENRPARAFWMRILELTAAQADTNVDIGTIVDDPPTETVSTTVTMTDYLTLPPNKYPYGETMVAVRSDGKYAVPVMFELPTDTAAQSVTFALKLPVGTWYLFPSSIYEVRMVPAIRRLLAGDSAAVDAANIPKVVVPALSPSGTQPPGPPPTVTIDFWPTLERMLKITPPAAASVADPQARPSP